MIVTYNDYILMLTPEKPGEACLTEDLLMHFFNSKALINLGDSAGSIGIDFSELEDIKWSN